MAHLIRFFFLIILVLQLSCEKKIKSSPDNLIIGISSAPNTLDPRFATDANGQRICNLIFSSLVRLGPDLEIVGELAESWNYKNLVYTFQLRPNIKFHSGRELTVEDILFSFEEYKKPSSPFNFVTANIEKIEAKYDKEQRFVKIKLKSYSAAFLTDLTPLKIISKVDVQKSGDDYRNMPIGTGPFAFQSMDNVKINLKKFENYFLEVPKMKEVSFHIIKDANTLYLKLYKGYVDIVQSDLPRTKIVFLERSKDFQIYKSPAPNMTYLLINMKSEYLKKLDVRKALMMSLNRKEIIKYKLEDLAIEASSILPPNNPFFHEVQPPPFDIEAGKKLLSKYLPFKSPIILKSSNDKTAVENGKVLAFQMRKLGIPIEYRSYEWGTFYGDLKTGNFDLATLKWVGATDPDIYRIAFHSKELPPGRNRGFYKNEELDKLLEYGLVIETPAERIQHYKKVQEIVIKDLPMIPLWYDLQVAAVSQRVTNYRLPKNGDYSFATWVSKK